MSNMTVLFAAPVVRPPSAPGAPALLPARTPPPPAVMIAAAAGAGGTDSGGETRGDLQRHKSVVVAPMPDRDAPTGPPPTFDTTLLEARHEALLLPPEPYAGTPDHEHGDEERPPSPGAATEAGPADGTEAVTGAGLMDAGNMPQATVLPAAAMEAASMGAAGAEIAGIDARATSESRPAETSPLRDAGILGAQAGALFRPTAERPAMPAQVMPGHRAPPQETPEPTLDVFR